MPEPDLRWHDFLDHIEADVAAATAALDDPGIPVHVDLWIPPQDLGAMPDDLAERAQIVLTAQREILERLQGAMASTGRQLAAVRSVPDQNGGGKSVYLDVTG